MSGKRTTMRKLREVLRLQAGLSIRAIRRSTKLSVGGVQKLLSRAEALELSWPPPARVRLKVLRPSPAMTCSN